MSGKICQICKQPSGIYPLCKFHLEEKNKGNVIKDEKTGQWIEITNNSKKKQTKEMNHCLICGTEIESKYTLCMDCYYDVEDRKEELDKNQPSFKLKDYYFNSKDYANRIFNENGIYYQQITMMAIAQLIKDLHNDTTLMSRISQDLENINKNTEAKNKQLKETYKEEEKIEQIKSQKDTVKAKTIQTQDGHFVESELEMKVDDILYNAREPHAYGIPVDEINERKVVCDWYIPVINDEGIYIELWGMVNNVNYEKNKKEKLELYKKHNLCLLEITNEDVKEDSKRLKHFIKSEINKKKNELLEKNKI